MPDAAPTLRPVAGPPTTTCEREADGTPITATAIVRWQLNELCTLAVGYSPDGDLTVSIAVRGLSTGGWVVSRDDLAEFVRQCSNLIEEDPVFLPGDRVCVGVHPGVVEPAQPMVRVRLDDTGLAAPFHARFVHLFEGGERP